MSTVKYMKILVNSNWGLNLHQKHLLYRSCILPITLYRFQLWYYNHTPLSYSLKMLGKMQKRAALWILGAFKTSPLFSIKAITGFIPINLYLQKLSKRSQLWAHSLSPNHIIQSLMKPCPSLPTIQHLSLLVFLTRHQCDLIKDHIVDINIGSTKFFHLLFPFILNSCPVTELLTLSQIAFLSTYLVNIKTII